MYTAEGCWLSYTASRPNSLRRLCLDADDFVGGGNAARAEASLIQGAVVNPCGDKG